MGWLVTRERHPFRSAVLDLEDLTTTMCTVRGRSGRSCNAWRFTGVHGRLMTLLWSCNLFLGWWIVQVLFAASIWIIAKFNEQLLMGAFNI
mmetsp:Transcript_63492/g.104877  ORF Transcript_63492/g.104877 Transcript_63492/m.104877 type:complete len:91 (-) Transcript_63492:294-566(-)